MAKPMYVRVAGSWIQVNSATPGIGPSSLPSRTTVTVNTASLLNGATENNTATMEIAYRIMSVTADRACRVRLYTTTTQRSADASRIPGTDPTGDHGVMLDLVFTAAGTLTMSPLVDGFLPSGTAVPYAIQNNSGSTSAVQVQISYIRTE